MRSIASLRGHRRWPWQAPDYKRKIAASLTVAAATVITLLAMTAGEAEENKPVLLGIDVLEARGFDAVRGKQIGLITNQTGVNSKGQSTAYLLSRAPRVRLVALFSPEHGIKGVAEHGQEIGDAIDVKTQVPVYSLYGKVQRPTREMLNAIDMLIFDMQDVGARYYTYLATMGMAMEEAARRNIEFVVLDRPNPLGGTVVEGAVALPETKHFTAYYAVPTRHGFTAGELAQWYNETANLGLKLKVIPMIGWNRRLFWPETGLDFTPPSPNIQTPTQALLYSGIGMFEATNLSVGRGTAQPFQVIGAPWIKGKNFIRRLNALDLPGVKFRKTTFVPSKELYEGQFCNGVEIHVVHPEQVRSVDIFVHVSCILRELYPNEYQLRWPEVARVTGTPEFEKLYKENRPASIIIGLFQNSAAEFMQSREKFLLY